MATKLLPNTSIVHDGFHLEKYLNDAIDKVRRREVKQRKELKNSIHPTNPYLNLRGFR